MLSEKDKINDLLRNGKMVNRKIRNSDISIKLEREFDFIKFEEKNFFKCLHEDDEDFDMIPEDYKTCDAEIEIKNGKEQYTCPQCQRTIYLEDKNFRFKKYQVTVIEKNVKKFIKDIFKNSGFTYIGEGSLTFDQQKLAFHKFAYDSLGFGICAMNVIFDKSLLDWVEIRSYPIIFILFDSAALSAQNTLEGRVLRYIDMGSLLTSNNQARTEKLLDLVRKCTIETKIKFWSSRARVIEKLEKREIDHNNYEQCVYVLLKSILDSTEKLGDSYIGSRLPDGLFTISPLIGRKYGFYVYDCKFRYVDEKKLTSADYRALCEYITFIRTSPVVTQSNFKDIDGFIIFSDKVRPSDLEKTLDYLYASSQRVQKNNPWKGKLIYFETESLILLTKLLAENREEIEQRKVFFYDHLNLFLHDGKLHQDSDIERKGVIHISQNDIKKMFEIILQRDPHEHRINAEDLIEELRASGLLGSIR